MKNPQTEFFHRLHLENSVWVFVLFLLSLPIPPPAWAGRIFDAPARRVHKIEFPHLVHLEAEYILNCQYLQPGDPAHGAINNVYGLPTWIVPRENAMAVLGLIEAARILNDDFYLDRAQTAADYLIRVQDPNDGAWYDQYDYAAPVILSKSPTQTAEVMLALNKLGYIPERFAAMKKGAQYLMANQDVAHKGGVDDGLLGGGKDDRGNYHSWRWTSDNSYAYWALRAARQWGLNEGDLIFADQCETAAGRILDGINRYLYVNDPSEPDYGVWRRVVDANDIAVDPGYHEWINYAPQMLDLPAQGVGSPLVGEWIHEHFQKEDGACVWDDGPFNQRKSPGYSFQASLCWIDLQQTNYFTAARDWTLASGLWQKTPDLRGIDGGWIDWIENAQPALWWQRFIDTSFYSIAAFTGGYDFRVLPSSDESRAR